MRHGSLFSGIGGFDLAAEWMGWENVFHCEWMEFPRKVLDYYWPDADSHVDICKTDFTKYANTIDILTGGFPCQPFSLAGKRKGTDDERYLWHEMLRAIREIKPKWVIAENVFGIVNIDGGMVFEQVCLDLEAEGYEVQPFIIPAAAKNAPHRRDRCWFVAYSDSIGYRRRSEQSKSNQSKEWQSCENEQQHRHGIRCEIEGCSWNATDTDSRGLERSIEVGRNGINVKRKSQFGNATDTDSNGQHKCNSKYEINTSERGINAQCNIESVHNDQPIIEHTMCIGQERRLHAQQPETTIRQQFDKRNARSLQPTNWQNFPTQSPICGGDDGLPTKLDGITFSKWRNESIKGYGNAIVPQIALQLFQIIEHESKNQNT
jgi:DNA (cytosine-5)-methyltransferase 1